MMGLIALVFIVDAFFLIKYVFDQKPHQVQSNTALEILKRRYASGDISREEFDEKKRDLV